MVTLSSIEQLATRVQDYLGTDRPRIVGLEVTSPTLSDGSQEIHIGNRRFVLSPGQMAERCRRLAIRPIPPAPQIHPHPDRIAMPADLFEGLMARGETQLAQSRPTIIQERF
jgi:hypothetical protein